MTEDDKALVGRLRSRVSNMEMLLVDLPRPAPDRDCHHAADRIEAQAAEIERLKYDGIHTCGDQCARPLCVAWREIEHLKDVYSSATECFLEADAENKRLREWSLKAFTVVEWVSGEGKLLSYPYYDADDLLGDGVELLGVYSSDDARAALGDTK